MFGLRRLFMEKVSGGDGEAGMSGESGESGMSGMDGMDVKDVKDVGSVCYGGGEFAGDLTFFRLVMRMRESQRKDALSRTLATMEDRRRWEGEVDAFIQRNLKTSTVKTLFD